MMGDMPTAGDYAWASARNAENIAKGAAEADASSRAELERQITVLRGQVAFLAEHLIDVVNESGTLYVYGSDMEMLKKIKENNW